MRRLIQRLLVFAIIVVAAGNSQTAAVAADWVVAPFACSLQNGKPILRPAAGSRIAVVGPREQRPFTACKESDRAACLTMMIHKFRVRCGSGTAAWADVAASVRHAGLGRSWIGNGHLNLVLKGTGGGKQAHFILPKGFAPIGELGARLMAAEIGSNPPALGPPLPPVPTIETLAGATPATSPAEVLSARSPIRIARLQETADAGVPLTVVVPAAPTSAVFDEADAVDPWAPMVQVAAIDPATRPDSHQDAGAVQGPSLWLMLILAGTSLAAAVGWFGKREFATHANRGDVAADDIASKPGTSLGISGPRPTGGIVGRFDAAVKARWVKWKWRRMVSGRSHEWHNVNIANGARSAEALYEKAESAVRNLGPASALRDTLSLELKTVRSRLNAMRGNDQDGRTARLAASLRAAVRDLERIGRIAESAAASLKTGRDGLVVPKTRAQAFQVLGLNPQSPESTLKRSVDALRMGWHPDHASDETDKAMREERTKQINIAWDLIAGKRDG